MKKIFLLVTVLTIILILPFFIKVKVISNFPISISAKTLFFAKRELKNKLEHDPLIVDYSIQFRLPNILEVNLIVKKPIFAVFNKNTNKYFELSKDGNITSITDSTTLPYVIQDTESINLFILNIIYELNRIYQVKVGEIKNGSMLVDMPRGIRVIFPLESDNRGSHKIYVAGLNLIYSKINSDYEGKYKEIDLRFINPVLR